MAEPVSKTRVGSVTATTWKNVGKKKDGTEFEMLTTTVENNYKDGEEWKTNSSHRTQNLLDVAEACKTEWAKHRVTDGLKKKEE